MKENNNKKLNYENLNGVISLGGKILKIIYILIIIVIVYAATVIGKEWGILTFIFNILKVLSPLFIGIVIAWLLDPLIMYLEKNKIKRLWGSLILYALTIGTIILVFTSFIPMIINELSELIKVIPSIFDDLSTWFNNLFVGIKSNNYFDFDLTKKDIIDSIQNVAKNLTTTLPNTVVNMVNGLFSALGTFFLGLMMGFYLLYDYDKVKQKVSSLIPRKYKKDSNRLTTEINSTLFGFVKGTLLSSTVVFVCASIALSIIGLKAPLLFALIAAILNVIPYIGPYLGIIPASIVGFSQNSATGILVIIVLGIIQVIEGNIIQPLIMSKAMKLSPITILISMLIFGYLFGMFGVILASPIAGVIKVIYQFVLEKIDKKAIL